MTTAGGATYTDGTMRPLPATPLCAIKGCEKRARKLGMCGEHAALAGVSFGFRAMHEGADAQARAVARVYRQAQAEVRKVLRDRA